MILQFLSLVGSVPTQDSRNIWLWVILGIIALALIVTCGILSAAARKSGKNHSDEDD